MCKKKIVQGQTIFSEKVNVFPIICFFYLDNIENVSTILHTHIFEESVGLPCVFTLWVYPSNFKDIEVWFFAVLYQFYQTLYLYFYRESVLSTFRLKSIYR